VICRPLTLSVVVPAYNEEPIILESLGVLRSTLDEMSISYEVLVVDDGSTDATTHLVVSVMKSWTELNILELQANRGHMAAITAGLEASRGEWVVTIDADLQDPPSVIPMMLERAFQDNVEVVYGVRGHRASDSWFKRKTANIYYSLMARLVGQQVLRNAADFRLMSRLVVDQLGTYTEKNRVYRLLVPWMGFSFSTVTYTREARSAGTSHYSIRKMNRLAWDSVASFSSTPLKIATYLGIGSFALFFIALIYVLTGWISGNTSPGWVSLMLSIVFFGSVQLISIGLLGEYVARIFIELQDRPIYSIKKQNTHEGDSVR